MDGSINGLKMHYEDSGGAGLPVVFVHAFPLSSAMWRWQIAALTGRARTIAYDVRGFGASELGDGQNALEYFVDDLLGLLDHLKIEKAVLCGLSMGGYIALRLVERSPARVAALVLCDTKSEADGNEAKLKRALSAKAVKRDGFVAFTETFMSGAFAANTLAKKPEAVSFAKDVIARTSPLSIAAALLAMAGRTDTTEALAGIKAPTLVLVGEQDALTPPAAARALAEKIPGAELHVIAEAAHLSNLENPAEFNRRLIAFLDRLQKSAHGH